ncbi:hypothetical protein [Streptomyces sp. NRRL S-337]|uniref:hypothetical protein n=1 Tax=Streptomyces sp. NRRL S-337 TaxID=1463900 RepID=UPI000AC105C8|nr:hypothetical protein [Streptomyces sp. NRRL S-337]
MESVSFTILAADPLSGAGAATLLRPYPTVSLLAAERSAEADVLLVLAGEITAETLDSIEQAVHDAANPRMRVVLVGDMVRKQHLLRAVNCGLISLIPRPEASTEQLLRAVIGARDGRAELPTQGAAWLLAPCCAGIGEGRQRVGVQDRYRGPGSGPRCSASPHRAATTPWWCGPDSETSVWFSTSAATRTTGRHCAAGPVGA